jgi:hypothetical protein
MCNILLVEDDWDWDTRGGTPYYTSTLQAAGYPFSHWDTQSMGTPTAGDMAPYDVVIWFTGYDWETPISPTEEVELIAYLDNGGNLLMSSQEQNYAFGLTPLMTDYFWVDSVIDDVEITETVGNAADPLFAGLGPYTLARPDQWDVYWPTPPDEGPYDDEVYVKAGGFEPFIYGTSGAPNATRYEGPTFKTMYLGWPFEWLPNLEDRVDLMSTALYDYFGCEPGCFELTGAGIDGPAVLQVGETGTYTVTLDPPYATPPFDILWDNGSQQATAAYSWTLPGVYTIVVTATNCAGTGVVTATFDVEVACDGLTGADITGPVQLLPGEMGTYMVALEPPTATLPIEILWSNGATGVTATYSWADPGLYTVAVTATNCAGTSVVTDVFEVEVLCIPVDEAAISGPATLLPGEIGTYTTTWGPPTATVPVDILWSNGMTETTAAYSWADPGLYTIGVTATNCTGAGVVTVTLPVEVVCDELTGATLSGPMTLLPGEVGAYTVTLEPPTATLPIEILWSNGMTGTTAVYSWTDPGYYTIVVTATNCGTAVVTATLDVTVGQPGFYVYLPLVAKND